MGKRRTTTGGKGRGPARGECSSRGLRTSGSASKRLKWIVIPGVALFIALAAALAVVYLGQRNPPPGQSRTPADSRGSRMATPVDPTLPPEQQIELLKDLDGVLGFIDARKLKNPDEMLKFAQFLKLLYQSAKKETFTGSIGILCEKEKYSDFLSKLDLSSVLGASQNARKSVFFYNLTDNYLLEIMDNLHMLFQALDIGTLDSSDM